MADGQSIVTLDEDDDLSKPITVKLDDKPSLAQAAASKVKERDAEIAKAKDEAARQAQRADHEARLRQQADSRVVQVETASRNTQVTAITSAIEARKSERAALRKAYSDALTAGDHTLAADINDKIADLAADQKNLEAAKFEAERVAKQAPQVQRELPSDPVERFIAERNLPSASASWIRANPKAIEDADKLAYAHNKAIRSHRQETPEYFAEVEKVMGLGNDSHPNVEVERDEPRQRRAPAAPPSSSADRSIERTASGGYVMTPEMREAARYSGVSDKEYLKAYLKIHDSPSAYSAEGKWSFSSADQ